MAQTKKQTPHTPTLQMVPPPPADPSVKERMEEDDDSPTGAHIKVEETAIAFDWLESIADLLRTADTGDLCHETVKNAAWLMQEIAEAGHACWRLEQEARREGR